MSDHTKEQPYPGVRAFGIPATTDLARARAVARECENLGYSTVWSNDTPLADGIVTAAEMAQAAGRIRVAVEVVACDRRPADQVAAALRASKVPLERFVLGIGAGGSKSLHTVREAATKLAAEFGDDLTIGIAAMGPQMCRLAGEIASLVLYNWMLPGRCEWANRRTEQGRARSARPEPVARTAYVRVALGAQGRSLIAEDAARYNRFPAYARHFRAMGAPRESAGVAGTTEEIPAGLAAYDKVLDETVVRALPAPDTVESTLDVARAAAPFGVH
ncbi:MAG: LLM class flavin-dependent oxidoreductase [Actinomycetota bacterium]